MKSPYSNLPPRSFWRSGVSDAHPLTVEDLYRKKFSIGKSDKIATAGSCFAQNVASYLKKNGFSVMDVEPAPPMLSETEAKNFGYGIYSARFGNIYTIRQLLQLARDAETGDVDEANVWMKDGRYYDALRPNVEPNGFESLEETLTLRRDHLAKVKQMFEEMNVLIFTLGLTEAWVDKRSGRAFPTAPGTIAGEYDPEIHVFENFGFNDIYNDFVEFHDLIRSWNPKVRILLTVSPVPLTATASKDHVLLATTYSKSVLRAVAGVLAQESGNIDYFPSYEMIASPWSKGFFYDANMRSVNSGGVAAVMRIFFEQHGENANVEAAVEDVQEEKGGRRAQRSQLREERRRVKAEQSAQAEAVCEELLLEAFAP